MYQIEGLGSLLRSPVTLLRRQARLQVSRNVVCLGLTSLFTDVSSEMVSAVLPMYFLLYLQLSPLAFGVVDGLYQGAAALLRVVSGLAADRSRRQKEIAGAGYALSAVCKLGLLAAGANWSALAAVVFLDRTGKGIRTAPRDALISLSSPQAGLATAFGVHRALDTIGALLGPLLAFALLALAPGAFDAVFVVSFCVALIGLSVLFLFVENRPYEVTAAPRLRATLRSAIGLLTVRRFAALIAVGGGLSLVTLSDSFLYLALQRRLDFSPTVLPLLYVGTSFVYLALAVPLGRLADQFGRAPVFVGGYALLALAYGAVLLPPVGIPGLVVALLLLGAFYAASDGVLMALASTILPPDLRASGLAVLTTVTSLGRLGASVVFGALWTWSSLEAAIGALLLGLLTAIMLAGMVLRRTETGRLDAAAL